MPCRDPVRVRADHQPGGCGGVLPRAAGRAAAAVRARSPRWPPRSPTTRPSRSATPPWRCSATSSAPNVDIAGPAPGRLAARRARAPSGSAATCTRSSRHVRGDSRPLVAHLAAYPLRRAAALHRGADDRVRRGHRGARGGVVDRRARDPGVRRRLVVHRAAGVRAPGAGPLRRGDGTLLRLAGRRARRRPLGARPGARALRDRRPRTPGWPGWTRGSPATAPRSTASATSPGTPPCTSCRWATSTPSAGGTTRSCAPSTGSAAGRWSTPARCCSAGRSPRTPPTCPGSSRSPSWPAATCSSVPRRRSSRCTARSRCWRSTTGRALDRLAGWAAAHDHPTQREVVAPLARALGRLAAGRHSEAADALAALAGPSRRLGGSDAQREIIEETRIAALVRADRLRRGARGARRPPGPAALTPRPAVARRVRPPTSRPARPG